jgi:branched-subunit amino acid aminotransferase/4-amino-4-deoxychorismate lyase
VSRRLLALLVVPLASAGVAGCGRDPSPEAQQRIVFLKKYEKLKDTELAAVCPSLYPSDYLKRPKHYRYDAKDRGYKPNATEKADAQAAGCTSQGTKPTD